jgi:YbbR domain-containing protein
VDSRNPASIRLKVEKRLTREIPVNVLFTGAVPEGFIADTENALLDYPVVNIKGPASVVELIEQARIDVDMEDRTESLSESYRYTLCDGEGNPVEVELVTTDVAEVHLDVKVQRFLEIPLKLNVVYGGGATEGYTRYDIKPKSIRVSGSEAVLADLTEIVLGTVDLSDILESTVLTYPIVLPEGVVNVTNVSEVHVSVSFPDLEIREYKVNNLVALNLPSGLEAQWLTTSVTVRLRGETDVLKKLTAEDISVVVDFLGAEIGAQIYAATILVDTDVVVGAIGNYEVYVSVQIRSPLAPNAYGTNG